MFPVNRNKRWKSDQESSPKLIFITFSTSKYKLLVVDFRERSQAEHLCEVLKACIL